jgi:hypothetical protein
MPGKKCIQDADFNGALFLHNKYAALPIVESPEDYLPISLQPTNSFPIL